MLTRAPDGTLRLPALATAHSHAFQRALRGAAQRPTAPGTDDFWSWRDAMYELASSLTPESIHAISLVAFRELARAGVRTVGEFHYVHHQPDGTPYDDRTILADAVVLAARQAKLRIALLRVAYHRDGPGRGPEAGQRRFCDPDVDAILRDVDTLRARYAGDPDVVVGLAPHSVRAVPPSWLAPLSEYAARHEMPLHMHVAEQLREVDECLAETGRRPVELLAEHGVLSIASSRCMRRTSPPTRRSSSETRRRSRASARRRSATSATGWPTSPPSRAPGSASAPASTATCWSTPSKTCARSRPTSGCGHAPA